MKKFISVAFPIVVFVLAGFIYLNSKVKADLGAAPEPSGNITAGDKTDKIEMYHEKVLFDIRSCEVTCPFGTEYLTTGENYAHVTADFTMKNTTSTDEDLDIIFPVPYNTIWEEFELETYDPLYKGNPSLNFSVKVNGQNQSFEYYVYKMQSSNEMSVLTLKFPISFKSNSETNIVVEYDTQHDYYDKSIYTVFAYIMETGSHWKDSIGSGEIIFRFPTNLIQSIFSEYNNEFVLAGKELKWVFENLEPTEDHNIYIHYSDHLLNIWGKKPAYLEDVFSSSNSDFGADWSIFPEGYKNSWVWLDGNPIYLLIKHPESETQFFETSIEGYWVSDLSKDETPWVQYEFNGVYEVDKMTISSGIMQEKDGKDYQLASRPKEIRLTFSDGSTQEFELQDKPKEEIVINLEKVNTSSVKMDVLSTYPDYNGENSFLGIEYLNFNAGKKVGEKVSNKDIILPQEFLNEGSVTTRIDEMTIDTLISVENFTLNTVGKNKVIFTDRLNLATYEVLLKLKDLEDYVDFSTIGKVSIDTDYLSFLKAGATVTMYDLKFEEEPDIYKDGKIATKDEVTNISYDKDTGTLSFDVDTFSTYEAREKSEEVTPQGKKVNTKFPLLATLAVISGVTLVGIMVVIIYKKRVKKGEGVKAEKKAKVMPKQEASGLKPEQMVDGYKPNESIPEKKDEEEDTNVEE